jgi:hypothetical protein
MSAGLDHVTVAKISPDEIVRPESHQLIEDNDEISMKPVVLGPSFEYRWRWH